MQTHSYLSRLDAANLTSSFGRVLKISSTHIEADGPACAIGDICSVDAAENRSSSSQNLDAEVVGIEKDHIILMPLQKNLTISPNALVTMKSGSAGKISVGDAFSGRAIDALGDPIDGSGSIKADKYLSSMREAPPTLDRMATTTPMPTGIKAIDAMLTLAKGQRVGVFAAAGVGKTTLVQQLAQQTEADRIVICLVGERGQEVRAMWDSCNARPDRDKYTLVASTSDESAALRIRAPDYALMLAEYWRSQGDHVLLILDSATRMAMALREVGLATGEPPTVRAYTPNVFAAIPRFVERCGALDSGGAISAVLTVLAENEEVDDPVCEMMKSVLDGHIVLSRNIAEQGQFPAIDIGRSISRHASNVIGNKEQANASEARKMLAIYEESQTFVESGVYRAGTNAELDRAIEIRQALNAFMAQPSDECVPFSQSFSALNELLQGAS